MQNIKFTTLAVTFWSRELEFDLNNSQDCCLSSTQIPPIPNGAYLSAGYTILEILETDLQKLNWLPIFEEDVKLLDVNLSA